MFAKATGNSETNPASHAIQTDLIQDTCRVEAFWLVLLDFLLWAGLVFWVVELTLNSSPYICD